MGPEFEPYLLTLDPAPLSNRGRLYTTQSWIDYDKLGRALDGEPSLYTESPSGWIFTNTRGQECYVLGDGNHRTALAVLKKETVPFMVVGQWNPNRGRPLGFNIIINKVKGLL